MVMIVMGDEDMGQRGAGKTLLHHRCFQFWQKAQIAAVHENEILLVPKDNGIDRV